ncbi:RNB domain-containing ribonuclease [Glaciihabitans sp. INWT7]|uniref:RNB domain-containing ribonuclease n=1 Tax=Glaciihabitans sp. INWT7 TaxID=2596912 RepID=UPI0016235BBB|nr:RNB domain-containing ribonuclease [Glaciihabitans sp. INWT7]QNE47877.1 RNB domain-containing ribonuclease [Glaciihabitans sp. INWT7]
MTVSSMHLVLPSSGQLAERFAQLRAELGLSAEFPAVVEADARSVIAHQVLPEVDSTAIPFVTIDPAGATDLDQALHLERSADGYRVRYAIADVPAFVAPNGPIDAEARRRGQTMYAPDGRIPLHPTVISEDAASLLPGEVRGAFVWDFTLDVDADVIAATVARARIRSIRQCDYAEVQQEIDAGTASDSLQLLREVGEKRISLERKRGGASLNRADQEVTEVDHVYRLERRRSLPVEDWNAQLSLMTGMAAAGIMIEGGVGILRTMPAPDASAIDRFRLQTVALGWPWAPQLAYGEYLRTLDSDDPKQLAIIHAAGSLFRGAGYTVFDGGAPEVTLQAAVGAPYAHTTAPLRRLVDRFVLVTCEAIVAGNPVPSWVRSALPAIPAIMAASDGIASRLSRGSIDAVEAAVLRGRVGEVFDATVISARKGGGVIQLADPAVAANCSGTLEAGSRVRATLVMADIPTGTVQFAV